MTGEFTNGVIGLPGCPSLLKRNLVSRHWLLGVERDPLVFHRDLSGGIKVANDADTENVFQNVSRCAPQDTFVPAPGQEPISGVGYARAGIALVFFGLVGYAKLSDCQTVNSISQADLNGGEPGVRNV
jgi:hypothetical protein